MKSGWICGRPAIFKLGDDCEWLQDFVRVIGKLMACWNKAFLGLWFWCSRRLTGASDDLFYLKRHNNFLSRSSADGLLVWFTFLFPPPPSTRTFSFPLKGLKVCDGSTSAGIFSVGGMLETTGAMWMMMPQQRHLQKAQSTVPLLQ
ncbi:hypothetical protein NL676_002060 [Syzygium grande]|nr:hypothetical protein NL676_002060 [Syzygium grande]